MFVRRKSDAPRGEREGLVSHILLQKGDVPDSELSITWVDLSPGSRQPPHKHSPEQVYVIIAGKGVMTVADAEREVAVGDMVYIPPNTVHGIQNTSDEVLSYISAATPAFDLKALYDEEDDARLGGEG
jgi:mannose-6-phosphate isomerase-like protein (cupin superfamily)